MNFDKLTDYLNYLVDVVNTPCVDCIVYKDHRMIYRYHTGKSDIEADKDISGNEIYTIFSMTKMLTCTAALQLYERGRYMMNDPISKYMPEFEKMRVAAEAVEAKSSSAIEQGIDLTERSSNGESRYAENPITVKDLFNMGAGLDYDVAAPGIKEALAEGKTSTRDLVGAMSKTILGFEPGTSYRYSLCHDVLGALIEIWSGMSLSRYIEENICKPLGMKDTFFGIPEESEERFSRMMTTYRFDAEGKPCREPLDTNLIISDDYESGGAGLCSTTEDYALFLDALACGGKGKSGNRILSSEAVKLMGMNHLNEQQLRVYQNDGRPGYGYGLGVRVHINKAESCSLSPTGEFGWGGAAGCFSMVDPENHISLTYFQQVFNWDGRIQHGMRNALYADLG